MPTASAPHDDTSRGQWTRLSQGKEVDDRHVREALPSQLSSAATVPTVLLLLAAAAAMWLTWSGWVRCDSTLFPSSYSSSWSSALTPHSLPSLWPNLNASSVRLSVVYNIHLHPTSNWSDVLRQQIGDLQRSGLPQVAVVHVALTEPATHFTDNDAEELGNDGEELIRALLPQVIVHRTLGNRGQYPGVRLLWDLAQTWGEQMEPGRMRPWDPSQHFILAMHNYRCAWPGCREQMRPVLDGWMDVIVPRLLSDPAVMKVGVAPSQEGFIRTSVYWVRASYLRTVVRPVLTERGQYYEDWLGRINERPGEPQAAGEAGVFKGPGDALALCKTNADMQLGVAIEFTALQLCF